MRGRAVALVMVVGLVVAAACGNEESGGGGGGSGRPGVTDDEIRVGGVVGKTNPVGRPYTDGFVGAKAYFDMINEEDGGVFGKEIKLVAERDDQSQASRNIQQVRALVEEDKVFAVLPVVSQIFAGAQYLADQGVPTFGWDINAEWALGPNLFGEKGSFLCFDCPFLHPPFVAQQVGATSAAVFAYGNAAQSLDCAEGVKNGFNTYGPPITFEDTSLTFGFSDLSSVIDGVRDNNVDFITTCMDVNGNANIAQALKDAGIEVKGIYSPEGYAQDVLDDLGDKVEGFYFGSDFVPFEAPEGSEGMQQFLAAMEKLGKTPSEQGLAGWINATLFVEGLKAAGKNFTQKSVVDAINEITAFTANGIVSEQDWTKDHAARDDADGCTAILQAQDGKFVPMFGEEGKPFVCFENDQVAKTGPPDLSTPTIRGAAAE
jgi:branched-chain amino acid transport system substrate-binding protein